MKVTHSDNQLKENLTRISLSLKAPLVQRLDNTIHQINHYPVDCVVCFVNTYPLDSDYPTGAKSYQMLYDFNLRDLRNKLKGAS